MGLIITLSVIGILLIIIEIILIPGIFITGILGVIALAASSFFTFQEYGNTAGLISIIVNLLLTILLISLSLRAKTWRRLSLKTEIDSRTDTKPEEKGLKRGDEGKTLTRLSPAGKVIFGNNVVEATARNGMIDPDRIVEISHIEDNKIYVKLK